MGLIILVLIGVIFEVLSLYFLFKTALKEHRENKGSDTNKKNEQASDD